MSANKGGGCSFFILLFVIGVFFQMMKDGCGGYSTNSTPSPTPSVNKDATWSYANERLKREGYRNQEPA